MLTFWSTGPPWYLRWFVRPDVTSAWNVSTSGPPPMIGFWELTAAVSAIGPTLADLTWTLNDVDKPPSMSSRWNSTVWPMMLNVPAKSLIKAESIVTPSGTVTTASRPVAARPPSGLLLKRDQVIVPSLFLGI